jgi:hypothetical protein
MSRFTLLYCRPAYFVFGETLVPVSRALGLISLDYDTVSRVAAVPFRSSGDRVDGADDDQLAGGRVSACGAAVRSRERARVLSMGGERMRSVPVSDPVRYGAD